MILQAVFLPYFLRDPDGQPKLSPEQAKVSPVWRRPSSKSSVGLTAGRSRRQILPQEILQHIVTDCSVCASISVCLEHGLRFGSAVSLIYSSEPNDANPSVV